jgi:type II secretory ATPase GspE/PulE/Tfp pilus assembly ATPase PilB-like protein
VSRGIRELILKREPAEKLSAEARREGFWPLRWKGLSLASRGVTTVEEILRVSAAQERDPRSASG